MAEPWQCPACKTWLAPQVREHRCDPDDGVGAKPSGPEPVDPMTTSITWSPLPGTVVSGWTFTNTTATAATPLTMITFPGAA
jgi:hypothetical protein